MEEAPEMRRIDKISNTIAVIIPFVATIAAMILFWNKIVTPADLIIAFTMYLVTGLGVTIGFHRLLTHRSFQTFRPIQYFFAILGSMSVQGPVITWTADHRKHHAHTDEEGDPHSPHVGHGEGFKGVMGGLWHAHIGWSMSEHGRADRKRYAADLCDDKGMVLIDRLFPVWMMLSLAIPTFAGYLVTGTAAGAWGGFLWGGLVRIFFVHHITWSINSLCHFMGTRRFATDDYSTNVFWLALP